MPLLDLVAPVAAQMPKELWAALIMLAFLLICVLTMALARIPTREAPPPLVGEGELQQDREEDSRAGDTASGERQQPS